MACQYRFPGYSVSIDGYRMTVEYGGLEWFRLPLEIDAGSKDRDTERGELSEREDGGEYELCFRAASTRWEEKLYTLLLTPDGWSFKAELSGARDYLHGGAAVRVDCADAAREIAYCSGAEYEASGYTLPLADHASRRRMYREAEESGAINMTYFAPPMFAFPFVSENAGGSVAIGVGAKPEAYNFDEFRYVQSRDRCGFVLPVPKGVPRGGYETPSLVCTFGGDEVGALAEYARWHFERLGCAKNACLAGAVTDVPRWWRGPFFCGWNEQPAGARALGLPVCQYDAARQDVYEAMSRRLDELGLKPTAIIIDDKWQKAYGTAEPDPDKWRSLRAFADAEHAKGRRVVLWFKTWNPEGLPQDECATLWLSPQYADPTNPKYRLRAAKIMRKLLSHDDGCCDCDGLKIDFMNCYTPDARVETYEKGVYGVELLHRMIALLRESAKAAKPDALVNCSPCHPYFAELCDQARLHDLKREVRNSVLCMEWRKALYEAAMPGVLIDTDEGGRGSRAEVLRYMRSAPELGAPDLYWLTPDADAEITPEDWAERRAIWEKYSEKQDRLYDKEHN